MAGLDVVAMISVVYLPRFKLTELSRCIYDGVSKSFRTESINKQQQQQQTLVEKQHKELWRQNSLDWLTKQRYNCT
jgi:hypothetical protein